MCEVTIVNGLSASRWRFSWNLFLGRITSYSLGHKKVLFKIVMDSIVPLSPTSPPHSYWSPDHKCDHMWRQGLFKEVIEVKWGHYAGFPGGAVVKKKNNCLRALETKELRVRSLGWEDALEQEMASVFLPGQRRLVSYSPWGHKESDVTEYTYMQPLSNRTTVSLRGGRDTRSAHEWSNGRMSTQREVWERGLLGLWAWRTARK